MRKPKLSDIRFDAVIIGALVDNVATMAVLLLLMSALASTGMPEDEVMARMKTLSGLLLSLIIGLGSTGLGGYAAARMAKQNEVLHGMLVAAAGIAIALIFREKGLPFWFEIAGFVLMPPAGVAGGYLGKLRQSQADERE